MPFKHRVRQNELHSLTIVVLVLGLFGGGGGRHEAEHLGLVSHWIYTIQSPLWIGQVNTKVMLCKCISKTRSQFNMTESFSAVFCSAEQRRFSCEHNTILLLEFSSPGLKILLKKMKCGIKTPIKIHWVFGPF